MISAKLSPFLCLSCSWDEMAAYDLPATVDKILSVTGAQQVFYVGHSQGCEIAIAELSRDPDFASKIKLFVGLAPATYLGDVKSPLIKLLPYAKDLEVKIVNVLIRNTLVSHGLSFIKCNQLAL